MQSSNTNDFSRTSSASSMARVPDSNVPEKDLSVYVGPAHEGSNLNRATQSMEHLDDNLIHHNQISNSHSYYQQQQHQHQQRNQVLNQIDCNTQLGVSRSNLSDVPYDRVKSAYSLLGGPPPEYTTLQRNAYRGPVIQTRNDHYGPMSEDYIYSRQNTQIPLQTQAQFPMRYSNSNGDIYVDDYEKKLFYTQQELIERTKQLTLSINERDDLKVKLRDIEKMLNKREYEIQELNTKHSQEQNKAQSQINKLQMSLERKNAEDSEFKAQINRLKKEFESASRKAKELEEHIFSLPTKDEYDEIKKQVADAQERQVAAESQHTDLERKYTKSKMIIQKKDNEIVELKRKLDEQALEHAKLQIEFDDFKQVSQETHELIKLRSQCMTLRKELDSSRGLIEALQNQNSQMSVKYKAEIASLKEQIERDTNDMFVLRNDLDDKQANIANLNCTIKEIKESKSNLDQLVLDQMTQIQVYEQLANKEYQKLLLDICFEVQNSVLIFNNLLNICMDIYENRDIDVLQLVDKRTGDLVKIPDYNLINGFITKDYLKEKLEALYELKAKLMQMKKLVFDSVAQIVGDRVGSCNQQ